MLSGWSTGWWNKVFAACPMIFWLTQGTLSQYRGMRGPFIQTDEYPSTESCARSVIDRIKSGRIS